MHLKSHFLSKFTTWLKKKKRGKLYLVGGKVRDYLWGKSSEDYDVVVSKDVNIREFFLKNNIKFVYYERGDIKTYKLWQNKREIDVCEMRAENIEEDLKKRDFTINAIAYDIEEKKFIDPLDGKEDIEHKRLKMCYKQAFLDDPLRIVRLFRFSTEFFLTIDRETLDDCKKAMRFLTSVSRERIGEELKKLFLLPSSFAYFSLMEKIGLMEKIFPHTKRNLPLYISLDKTIGRWKISFNKHILLSLKIAAFLGKNAEKHSDFYCWGKKIGKSAKLWFENKLLPYKVWNKEEGLGKLVVDFEEDLLPLSILSIAYISLNNDIKSFEQSVKDIFLNYRKYKEKIRVINGWDLMDIETRKRDEILRSLRRKIIDENLSRDECLKLIKWKKI
ncbi:MAG: CCA tRNA nucleotidyltransferase [Deltaproteobacteria bacterium]|nr:CCA tRNA nucleotidyltransferase [Deltaproteobacteria bacterium]